MAVIGGTNLKITSEIAAASTCSSR